MWPAEHDMPLYISELQNVSLETRFPFWAHFHDSDPAGGSHQVPSFIILKISLDLKQESHAVMGYEYCRAQSSSSVDLNLSEFFPLFLLQSNHEGPEDIQYAKSPLCWVWAENNEPVPEQRGISVTTLCLCLIIFPRQCGQINHFVLRRNYSKLVIMIR